MDGAGESAVTFDPGLRGLIRKVRTKYVVELRQACESEDKKKFTEISRKFLAEFLTFERQQNGFRLGLVRGTEDNVMSRDFTSREQAFLDFCKPGKWVGKTKQYNQTDEEY